MIRRKCVTKGHRWGHFQGDPTPFDYCTRWFCQGERVAAGVPPGPFRDALVRAIPDEHAPRKWRR